MKVSDFRQYLCDLRGKFNPDEGLLFGDEDNEIRGIQVSWMVSLDAIENAHNAGTNLMLVHEAFFILILFRINPNQRIIFPGQLIRKGRDYYLNTTFL